MERRDGIQARHGHWVSPKKFRTSWWSVMCLQCGKQSGHLNHRWLTFVWLRYHKHAKSEKVA